METISKAAEGQATMIIYNLLHAKSERDMRRGARSPLSGGEIRGDSHDRYQVRNFCSAKQQLVASGGCACKRRFEGFKRGQNGNKGGILRVGFKSMAVQCLFL
ncbi:hypothetical protein WN944_002015 [Citrus x changshan-huyou]|uniref:Uncharacterized protein n=1 Tax=Citrus x changshan-huyou TaxID=2935761 RepID=A0AAP0MHI0_9ROSI